jgi:serine protease inhibitor
MKKDRSRGNTSRHDPARQRDARVKPELIEMRVDHSFLFAIEYRRSGACLFLGRRI